MTSTDTPQDKELLERYRRASAGEAAAPSEAVRAAILAEGRRAAAERATRTSPDTVDVSRPAANDARWKITAFGTAGAAILAALLFAPRYWESQTAPIHSDSAPAAAPAPMPKVASKTEEAIASESADVAPEPSLTPAAPAAKIALEPRKNLRIAHERPPAEPTTPPAAAQNYAPAPPAAAQFAAPPAATSSQLAPPASPPAAPSASPPAFTSGARSMSADRAAAAENYTPAAPVPAAPGTALLSAAASGDLTQATALLDRGAPIDERDGLGRTALMLAASQGRVDIIRLLLERGADPNAADNAGKTPLKLAKQKNLRDVVALLERAGAR